MPLINYFQDTKAELRHVNWPTQRQGIYFALLVIGISLILGLLLGFFDLIFAGVLQFLTSHF